MTPTVCYSNPPTTESDPIRAAIIEPDENERTTVRRSLAQDTGIRVVEAVCSGEDAVERIPVIRPHVVLMEYALPGIGGVATTRQLLDDLPGLLVLMLTREQGEEEFFSAVCAGVSGYLLKPIEPTRLRAAVRVLAAGGAVISPHLATRLAERFAALSRPQSPEDLQLPITTREQEVLRWLMQGYTNEEIAEALSLSTVTVKSHVRNLLRKLGLWNRSQLAALATQMGLIAEATNPPRADRELGRWRGTDHRWSRPPRASDRLTLGRDRSAWQGQDILHQAWPQLTGYPPSLLLPANSKRASDGGQTPTGICHAGPASDPDIGHNLSGADSPI